MAYDRGDRDYRDYRSYRDDGREDRGFFERAGDEVRSWFGDDEAERRRRMDERFDDRVDRQRFASTERGGYRPPNAPSGWYRSNRDEFRRGGYGSDQGYPNSRDWEGRQFDNGGGGADYGRERLYDRGERGYEYRARQSADARSDHDRSYGASYGVDESRRQPANARDHDEHGYGNWRDRQLNAFDRDYHEYRAENQSRFETEFAAWRQNRQTQRDALTQVKEQQEVVGSDGTHVGTVDHVRSDHILLTRTDTDAGGQHHSIPSSWIATVGETVQLSKTAAEAKRRWEDGDRGGGLSGQDRGDRDDDRQPGHGRLNRSFSGTY